MLNLTIAADDEGEARSVLITGFLHRTKGQAHAAVFIGQQLEGEVKLLAEGFVVRDGINRNTEYQDATLLEVLDSITESMALLGSARGVGLGVEPQDGAAPRKIRFGDAVAIAVEGCEGWTWRTRLQHGGWTLKKSGEEGAEHGLPALQKIGRLTR